MSKMGDFVIEIAEELIKIKPYLSWEEAMERVTGQQHDPDVNKIKIQVFNRSYNK